MLDCVTYATPDPLEPGDCIAVVAPSSPYAHDAFWRGLAWLRARYRVRMSRGIFARKGYLAGDDARRARELADAMVDPSVKAIVAARGGYGAMRIVDALPWEAFARAPKWLVGFSDVTALHAEAWRLGVTSIHGPNVTTLAAIRSPRARAAWIRAVERPHASSAWKGLRVLHPGSASGPIVGGNLAIVHALAAAGRLSIPAGSIFAVEDVGEAGYRVDRMITSLLLGPHLRRAAGLVFGDFTRCTTGPDGPPLDAILEERTRSLGVPVLAGAPFGHGDQNEAFVLGGRAVLAANTVRFAASGS